MTTIAHGVRLNRYPIDGNPDSVGTHELWARPIHEIYAQMPFPTLFNGLTVEVAHIDTAVGAELKARNAAGLAWGWLRKIQFSVHANRPPEKAVLTFSHEFGHFYQWECRLKLDSEEADEITRHIRFHWDAMKPGQGHNDKEDWAEVCRAVFGCNRTRGTYSDDEPAKISSELRSLIRCAYWLSLSLASKPVSNISPRDGGVMYCVWDESKLPDADEKEGWRWRWLNENSFRSQEWTGKQWIQI